MNRTPTFPILAAALVLAACAPSAPPPAPAPQAPVAVAGDSTTRYSLRPIPVPADYEAAVARGTRTLTGEPGPRYWQQEVDYQIDAELDPETSVLRGTERIAYENNSPDTLRAIYLNLYQNVYSEGVPRNRYAPITGGITLERVVAQGQPLDRLSPAELRGRTAGYTVRGTLGALLLPRPIAPGESAVLEIEWRTKVPPEGSFRTAWEDALGGRVFQVAQWYPQVATYDDIDSWDDTPYLGDGEFYLEYGDFDVSITVPAGHLVGATGVLQNPEEVLTEEALARLAAALRSDSITQVVTEADLMADNATQMSPDGQLTWRFQAEDVRDFGFATSDRYVWDATRAIIPSYEGGTRPVAVHALYRPGAPGWERAAEYGQFSVDYFSNLRIPYLYPQISIAEGPIGGMEYPQLIFIGRPPEAEQLFGVIAHEVAHEWFPMMVGSNEAEFAWMDEGITEYHEALALEEFFPETDPFAGDLASYLRVAGTESEVPLMRHTDLVSPYGARVVAAYTKPAVLFRSLRALLGEETLREAVNTYAREWLLKHPTPWDFFNTVERVSGRELDWFFYPWWFETGTLDQAVTEVEGAATGTVRVTVADLGDIPVPALVAATTAGGETVTATIPIETWLGGVRSAAITLDAPGPVVRVVVDPEQLFPDVDPENNVWTAIP